MSVLRDAMELGYGTNHFMVTGENFPSNWNDPIEKESSYDDEDENCITSLDTTEGWFKRNRFILNTEKDIGAIDGESYYHFNQTMTLDGVVCGRGRNPTLRLWPTIFSGKIDVFPGDRRSRLISSMTSVAPA